MIWKIRGGSGMALQGARLRVYAQCERCQARSSRTGYTGVLGPCRKCGGAMRATTRLRGSSKLAQQEPLP